MPDTPDLLSFIRDTYRSVWSMELMLLLKSEPRRAWRRDELVDRLRASEAVVVQGVESLVIGGLVVVEDNGDYRFAPASDDLERLSGAAEDLYAKKPDAVRRLIVSANDQLSAFADAFRLRRD